jgi:uncharacterized membrane protein YdjX (TVP38/TMEM64 family)
MRPGKQVAVVAVAIVLVAAALVALVLVPGVGDAAVSAARWLRRAGALGVLVFAAAFVIGSLVLAPDGVFSVGAGYAYGMVAGSAIALVGAILSAVVAFELARGRLRGFFARRFERGGRVAELDRAVHEHGAFVVILVRVAPVLPFAATNYLFAMTSIRRRAYFIGSAVGMVPWTLAYAYLGSIAPVAVKMLHGQAPLALPLVGIAVALVVAIVLSLLAARALREHLPPP